MNQINIQGLDELSSPQIQGLDLNIPSYQQQSESDVKDIFAKVGINKTYQRGENFINGIENAVKGLGGFVSGMVSDPKKYLSEHQSINNALTGIQNDFKSSYGGGISPFLSPYINIVDPRKFADKVYKAGYSSIATPWSNLVSTLKKSLDIVSSDFTGATNSVGLTKKDVNVPSWQKQVGTAGNLIYDGLTTALSPITALFNMAGKFPVANVGMDVLNDGIKAVMGLSNKVVSDVVQTFVPGNKELSKQYIVPTVQRWTDLFLTIGIFNKLLPSETAKINEQYVRNVATGIIKKHYPELFEGENPAFSKDLNGNKPQKNAPKTTQIPNAKELTLTDIKDIELKARREALDALAQKTSINPDKIIEESNKLYNEQPVDVQGIDKLPPTTGITGKQLEPVKGNMKIAGSAKKLEAWALKNELIKSGLDNLPEYNGTTADIQSSIVSHLINNEFDLARKILRGETEKPPGLVLPALYTGMKEWLDTNKDNIPKELKEEIVQELANTRIHTLASEAGQTLRFMSLNPVDRVTEISDRIRNTNIEKATRGRSNGLAGEVKDMQGEDISKITEKGWKNIINKLEC